MTYFVFCIHNHQPVGNFEHVLEEAYRQSYWPFLQALSRHPAIKMTIHNSGFLFDWMIERHPEYINLLKSMVSRKQVEILGGGYYEPILPVIPQSDRLAQIRMMSDKIEEVFATRPRGAWLAERVWEPALPATIKKAGLEYILVDDYHFIKSGAEKSELGGYYITEDQGDVIKIYPGNEELRYLIPFKPLEKLEEYLKGLNGALRRGNAAIYGDDGEKFGVWPGTHKWVFDEGWLEGFFKKIEANLDWLKPVTLSEHMDLNEPVGQIYLPTTSYMEMGEWSLPAASSRQYSELVDEVKTWKDGERVRRFLQGGTWRNFFSKYPESNWMHKRMLMVSRFLQERAKDRQWDEHLSSAERFLYKAQCNDAYWHGVFGGLYLPHLRTKVYENLIKAEDLAGADIELKGEESSVARADLDADDHEEILLRTKDLNLFFSPRNGASLFELDFKPRAINLSNTLSRWFEGYHHKLEQKPGQQAQGQAKSIHEMIQVKEEGLEKYLKYDRRRRASFVDHFLGEKETLEAFFANEHKELGDFHENGYDVDTGKGKVLFSRKSDVLGREMHVSKEVRPAGPGGFKVDYFIKSLGRGHSEGLRFAVELNLILPCCDGPACLYRSAPPMAEKDGIGLGSTGKVHGLEKLSLIDKYTGVRLDIDIDRPATLWRFPVHTVSLSEGGFEKIYQGSCLVFLFPVNPAGTNISFDVSMEESL